MNYEDLKDFLETLSEDQLKQKMMISIEEEPVKLIYPSILTDDIYYDIDDHENCGTIEELKECNGSDLDINNYKISFLKGTVLFFEF